jgi:predicted aminopeptidase
VIHEITHNSLFVRGAVAFNESYASFVGARGAAAFFREGGNEEAARRAERRWEDDKQLGAFWGAVARAIDSAYAAHPRDSLARVAARDGVYARMRATLLADLAPRLSTVPRAALERMQLDNAALLARRVYASDLWLFDEVYRRLGGHLPRTLRLLEQLAGSSRDPFAAVRTWLGSSTGNVGTGATAVVRSP